MSLKKTTTQKRTLFPRGHNTIRVTLLSTLPSLHCRKKWMQCSKLLPAVIDCIREVRINRTTSNVTEKSEHERLHAPCFTEFRDNPVGPADHRWVAGCEASPRRPQSSEARADLGHLNCSEIRRDSTSAVAVAPQQVAGRVTPTIGEWSGRGCRSNE